MPSTHSKSLRHLCEFACLFLYNLKADLLHSLLLRVILAMGDLVDKKLQAQL